MPACGNRQKIVFAAVVALCSALPFLQAAGFPFLMEWDDIFLYDVEPFLLFKWENVLHWIQGNYCEQIIPMTFFSFMADYAVDGLNPMVFHIQNILWHAVACAGVFMCISLFNVRPWLAFALALAYAIHPQKAESVAWISERKDVLCGAFAVWSFYFYAKAPADKRFAPLPLALFALSALSKPAAISFPAALLCFELTRARPFNFKAIALKLAPFFAISAALALRTIHHSDDVTQNPVWMRLFICLRNLLWYIWTTLTPMDLLPLYPRIAFNAATVIPVALAWLAVLAGMAFLLYKSKDFLLWRALPVMAMFAAAHVTTIGLVRYNNIDYADRYNYVPSAIVCFAIAWLLSRLLDRLESRPEAVPAKINTAVALALGLWLANLTWLSFSYCKTFSSDFALFSVATCPEKPNPTASCTMAMIKYKANMPAGEELYRRLEAAKPSFVKKEDVNSKQEFILAKVLIAAEAVRANPSCAKEHIKFIQSQIMAKRPSGARDVADKTTLLRILLDCQFAAKMSKEASETLRMMAEESTSPELPQNPMPHYYMGKSLLLKEDYGNAVKQLEKAVALQPNSDFLKWNLKAAIELRDSKRPVAQLPTTSK